MPKISFMPPSSPSSPPLISREWREEDASFRLERRVTLKPTSGSEGHLSHCVKSSDEDRPLFLFLPPVPILRRSPKWARGCPRRRQTRPPRCASGSRVFSPGTLLADGFGRGSSLFTLPGSRGASGGNGRELSVRRSARLARPASLARLVPRSCCRCRRERCAAVLAFPLAPCYRPTLRFRLLSPASSVAV